MGKQVLPFKELLNHPKEIRNFFVEYLEMIESFNSNIEVVDWKLSDRQREQNSLAIKNTDLWIEAYIDIFPDLEAFRTEVRDQMERLDIERHPDFVYTKQGNHYYTRNERTIEKLRELIQTN